MGLCGARSTWRSLGDYWSDKERELNISFKEMLTMCYALQASPKHIRDCHVDVKVDSRVVMDTYYGQGRRKSHDLSEVTKQLYRVVVDRNLELDLCCVPSNENQADRPSRWTQCSRQKLGSESRARSEVHRDIGPVLRFLANVVDHLRLWYHVDWPRLMAMCSEVLCLAEKGDREAVPSSRDISHVHACSVRLLACRVSRF